jgi:hypothetical protein
MTNKTGGPAFSGTSNTGYYNGNNDWVSEHYDGMTLWDWFAAHVPLDGLSVFVDGKKPEGKALSKAQAYWAAEFADAMLDERKKRGIK